MVINFNEEIKRYSPSMDVSKAEEDILNNDLKDITDIVLQMTEDIRKKNNIGNHTGSEN